VCRTCLSLQLPASDVLYWRVTGTATTGQGRMRTVPAAITLGAEQLSAAWEFAAENSDQVQLDDQRSFGPWRCVTLYRTDLLPDFKPTA